MKVIYGLANQKAKEATHAFMDSLVVTHRIFIYKKGKSAPNPPEEFNKMG